MIYISIMRTDDGGHLSQEYSYKIGDAILGYHYVRDSALKWSASGKLFIAAQQHWDFDPKTNL